MTAYHDAPLPRTCGSGEEHVARGGRFPTIHRAPAEPSAVLLARGDQPRGVEAGFDDSGWAEVQVPHDRAIGGPFLREGDGNTGKLPWRGQGWCRRELEVPAAWRGRRVYLLFDGVMAFPRVWVNGALAGSWDYGYTSFYLGVTDHLTPGGPNLLAVHADTREHDSRRYPGGGSTGRCA